LLLGAAFAWFSMEELSRLGGSVGTRSLAIVTLFGILVYAPATAYFLAFSPDWTYAYWIDSQKVPDAFPLGVALSSAASVPFGFAASARSAAANRPSAIGRFAAVPAILASASVLVAVRRLGIYATYAQYHGDFGTESVAGSPLGYALLWMVAVVAGAAAWTAGLRRDITDDARRD
jgi:hypothetical protein